MTSQPGIYTCLAFVSLMICIVISYTSWNNKQINFFQSKTLFPFRVLLSSPSPVFPTLSRVLLSSPSAVSPTPLLYVRLHSKGGRLGNHLYQYASLLGIARRNNRTPIWARGNIELEDIFKIKMLIDKKDTIAKSKNSQFVLGPLERDTRCYQNWTETLPNRNMSIHGFLQSRLYFNNIERELRTHFKFKDSIINQARSMINKATRHLWNYSSIVRNKTMLVAIHVRRGDYLSKYMTQAGWAQPSIDYYKHSMQYFNTRYSNVTFLLFSDDIKWCRKNIHAANIFYIEGQTRVIDLAVASLCDHAIVTQGSFGQWIAWFTNGVTLRPRNIPAPGSPEFREMIVCGNYSQYYYPKNCVAL